MEELRSTEILDKEIEADARKKAEKILRKTEEESKKILESVSERLEAVKKEKSLFFDEKIKDFENDKLNSFPLEKQRFLVKFIQNAFSENINDFLNSLTNATKRIQEQSLESQKKQLEYRNSKEYKDQKNSLLFVVVLTVMLAMVL